MNSSRYDSTEIGRRRWRFSQEEWRQSSQVDSSKKPEGSIIVEGSQSSEITSQSVLRTKEGGVTFLK